MAEENRWKREEEDEEEEELDETAYKAVKDAVLFVIEVSPSMLAPPPPSASKKANTDSATSAALKCAYALMQQRIISNPNDMMGVLLYGTEETKFQGGEQSRGSLAYPHCYLLTDLDIPAAEDVKALKALADDEEESQKLLKPSKEPVAMANVLFCANQIFTTRAPNFSSRRVFIVTDNDDPHTNEKALKSSAAVRAKDLYDLGVMIELFPISKPGHEFDRGNFYDDIIYNPSPSDPEAPAPISGTIVPSATHDGISLLTSLLSSINSKAVAKRALFSNLPLEIGPGFKISVRGYIIFKRQEPKRSCFIWLNGEKAQIATGVTTQMADDTARTVEKVEIKKAYKFGGEQITFTPEEVTALRHFGGPGIRIIGFKPMSMLPFWANLRPSTFIYPSEDDYVGSTRVFAALQKKLLDDDKMGVAWYVARKNATPQIAAIIPGAEKLDEFGAQVMPPGLWIVPLPFADDVRQNPETTLIRAPEPLIDRMREVVQQLQLPKAVYDPSRYPNPSLQWHYRILQAMALEEDLPEKPDDKTIPKYRQIDKRAGPYAIDWGTELHAQHAAWEKDNRARTSSTSALGKRPAPASSEELSVRSKKTKTEVGADDALLNDAEMKKLFDKKSVKKTDHLRGGNVKLTVMELKNWLAAKSLDVNGRKADLVDRVDGFFETL